MKCNYRESAEEYAKYQGLMGEQQIAALARESFAKGGWQGFLRAMVERPDFWSYSKASYYLGLSEKDKAFAELGRTFEYRDTFVMSLEVDPTLDPLRDDPRLQTSCAAWGCSAEPIRSIDQRVNNPGLAD